MLTKEQEMLIVEATEIYISNIRKLMLEYKDKKTEEDYREYKEKASEYVQDLIDNITENMDKRDPRIMEVFRVVYEILNANSIKADITKEELFFDIF